MKTSSQKREKADPAVGESALQGSCQQGSWQGATSSGSTPVIDQPFGANTVGQIIRWR